MEIQASRTAARTDADGNPVLLTEQNRARWDHLLIRRGLVALERAQQVCQALGLMPGSYQLQGEIAACHARAARVEDTDWVRMAALYAELMRIAPSPVVELNRAVAVSMAEGPQAGLDVLAPLLANPALKRYHWLPAVEGDFLRRLGWHGAAREALLRAADMASNAREQALLRQKAADLASGAGSDP